MSAGVLLAGLQPRPIRGCPGCLVRAAPEDLGAAHPGVGLELLRRARLTDARLADEHHQPAVTRDRAIERLSQPLQLLLAAYENTQR